MSLTQETSYRISEPQIEWCIGKCPGFCTIFFKTSNCYLMFMLYHAVIENFGTFQFLAMLMPKLGSGGFKITRARFGH